MELALNGISVIVIYQKKTKQLGVCLESIEKSFLHVEQPCELLCSNEPNKSVARNNLAKSANGDILVFIDSDAEASDFWLHELIKPFNGCLREIVGVVGGPNLIRDCASHGEVLADKILTSPLATWKSSSRYKVTGRERFVNESELTSCNLAIKRKVFLEVGGFPADVIPCEENVLLNNIQKHGYHLIYNPLAIVFHNRAALLLPHLRKIFFYASGRGLMMRKGKGGLKLFPRPNLDYLILGVAFVLHYFAYVAGLIWGLLKG